MAVDLRSNLKTSGEKFYWDSTLVKLKEFVSKELRGDFFVCYVTRAQN
jgi:hypothetical protein